MSAKRIAAVAMLWSLALAAHARAAEDVHVPSPRASPAMRGAPASVRKLGAQLAAVGRLAETRVAQREMSEVVQKSSLDSAKSYLVRHKKELTPFEKNLLSITVLLDSRKYSAVALMAAAGHRLTGNRLSLFKQLLEALRRNPAIRHLKDEGLRLQQHPSLLTARLQAVLSNSSGAHGQPRYVRRTAALLSEDAAPGVFEKLPPLIVGLLLQPAAATASSSSACISAADHRRAVLGLSVDTVKQVVSSVLWQTVRMILADSISLHFGIAFGVSAAFTFAPAAAATATAVGVGVFAYFIYRGFQSTSRHLQGVQAPLCTSRSQSPEPSRGDSGPITLEPIALAPAMQYVPYSEQLAARAEVQPRSWRLEKGESGPSPAPLVDAGEGHYYDSGLSMFYVTDEGLLWMLTGKAGEYTFIAEATEPDGQVVRQPYTVSIAPAACSSYPCAIWDKFQPTVPLLGEMPEPGELTYTFVWNGDPCRSCIGFWPLIIDTSETGELGEWIICFEFEEPSGAPRHCSVTYSFAGFGSSHRTSEVSIYFEEVGPPPHSGPVPIGSWTVTV